MRNSFKTLVSVLFIISMCCCTNFTVGLKNSDKVTSAALKNSKSVFTISNPTLPSRIFINPLQRVNLNENSRKEVAKNSNNIAKKSHKIVAPTADFVSEAEFLREDSSITLQHTELAANEQLETPAFSASGEVNGVQVVVTANEGVFPEGTTMTVEAIPCDVEERIVETINSQADDENNVVDIAAVDITFYFDGEEIQPNGEVFVSMKTATLEGNSHNIFHASNSGANVNIIADASATGASFTADSFSIYAIVGTGTADEQARRFYSFYLTADDAEAGEDPYNYQIIKNWEKVIEPERPEAGEAGFYGWFLFENGEITDRQMDFSAEINDIGKDDENVSYVAKLQSEYYVIFHESEAADSRIIKTITGTFKPDETNVVNLADINAVEIERDLTSDKGQTGWSREPGGTVITDGIPVSEPGARIDLYPVVEEGYELSSSTEKLTLVYDAGAGNAFYDNEQTWTGGNYRDGASAILRGRPEKVLEGYYFIGWQLKGQTVIEGSSVTLHYDDAEDGIITLYAVYTQKLPAVSLILYANYPEESSVEPHVQMAENLNNAEFKLPDATDQGFSAPAGYEFYAWNTAKDGIGARYEAGRAVGVDIVNADNVLYAQWKKKTDLSYTVRYVDEKNEDIKAPEIEEGQTYGSKIEVFADDDDLFARYRRAEDNTGKAEITIDDPSEKNVVIFRYVRKPEVTVTIIAKTETVTYDGKEHTVSYGVKINDNGYGYTKNDFHYEETSPDVKGTNAGIYDARIDIGAFVNDNNNYFVQFSFAANADGTIGSTINVLTIKKRNVTLTSETLTKPYDGKPLQGGGKIEVTGDDWADGEGAEYTFTGSRTYIGGKDQEENKFGYKLKDGTLADNYEIEQVYGDLIVTERDNENKLKIVVTAASDTFKYDGQPHTVEGFVDESGQKITLLMNEDREAIYLPVTVNGAEFHVYGLTAGRTETNAGEYTVSVGGTATVMDADGNDVTSMCSIETISGTLTIRKGTFGVTAAGYTGIYDGYPHFAKEVELTDLPAGFDMEQVTASYETRKDSAQGDVYADYSRDNVSWADIQSNDIDINKAYRIVSGTSHVTLTVSIPNYENVTAEYDIIIKKRPIIIQIDDAEKYVGEDDPEWKLIESSYQFNANGVDTGLAPDGRGKLISYTINREPGEEVGTYAIDKMTDIEIVNHEGEPTTKHYEITVIPGTLTVKPVETPVTPEDPTPDCPVCPANLPFDITCYNDEENITKGTFTAETCTSVEIEGVTYETVLINGHCWMKENLRTASDNSLIYSTSMNPANEEANGRLYLHEEAVNLCPQGWHLPTITEIAALSTFSSEELRSDESWIFNGNNLSGFSAQAAGFFNSESGRYERMRSDTYFHSESESFIFSLDQSCCAIRLLPHSPSNAYSIRCVKDSE